MRLSTTEPRIMSRKRKSQETSSASSYSSSTDSDSREGRKKLKKNDDNEKVQSIMEYLDKKLVNIEWNLKKDLVKKSKKKRIPAIKGEGNKRQFLFTSNLETLVEEASDDLEKGNIDNVKGTLERFENSAKKESNLS